MQAISGEKNQFIRISLEELNTEKNLDINLKKAAKEGFFYLQMPKDCSNLIHSAINFAHSFYTNKETKELTLEGFSGYHDRSIGQIQYQVESLYLEREYWQEQLSEQLPLLAEKMHALAVEVLKKTLSVLGIPEKDQTKISGNISKGEGQVYFTLNHYRPEKAFEGLGEHRDFGQITVLFINQMGLQAKIEEKWVDVPPLEGYFVINFGRALEYSINNKSELIAALHRVEKVKKDRISLGVFLDNEKTSSLYQKKEGQIIDTKIPFSDYIQVCFSEQY